MVVQDTFLYKVPLCTKMENKLIVIIYSSRVDSNWILHEKNPEHNIKEDNKMGKVTLKDLTEAAESLKKALIDSEEIMEKIILEKIREELIESDPDYDGTSLVLGGK